LSPTKSRLEDLLVLGSPKKTRKATILEDKFVAQDVAFDKKCCSRGKWKC